MSWKLVVTWAHRKGSNPPVNETFDTKAEGITRAAELLADGLTVSSPGSHEHYPAAAIRYVGLKEDSEE